MKYILLFFLTLFLVIILYKTRKIEYFKSNQYNIYLYWENKKGHKRHKYLDICLQSIKKHNKNVVVLTPENLYNYIPKEKVNEKVWLLDKIAQRADYLRYLVLNHNGGFWFDFDTICLKNIEFLFKNLVSHDMVYHSEQFFGVRKGALNDLIRELEYKLNNRKNMKFYWTELGVTTLKKYFKDLKIYYIDNNKYIKPKLPYGSKKNKYILWKDNVKKEDFIKPNQIILKLYNHGYSEKEKNKLVNDKNNLFNKIIIND